MTSCKCTHRLFLLLNVCGKIKSINNHQAVAIRLVGLTVMTFSSRIGGGPPLVAVVWLVRSEQSPLQSKGLNSAEWSSIIDSSRGLLWIHMVLLGLLKAFTKHTFALTSKFRRKCKGQVKCVCNMHLSMYTIVLKRHLQILRFGKPEATAPMGMIRFCFFEHKLSCGCVTEDVRLRRPLLSVAMGDHISRLRSHYFKMLPVFVIAQVNPWITPKLSSTLNTAKAI